MTAETQSAAGHLVLETERLRLRRFRREDVDAVFAIIGDAVAMKYYPKTFGYKDAEQWVERNFRRYAEHGHGFFAVTLKDADEMIGDCGIIHQTIDGKEELEVGYHVRRDQWGHGYATEAAKACMSYGFDALGAEKLISLIRPENVPSRRVAERNGMKIERQIVHWGLPHLVYATRRAEFDFLPGLKPRPQDSSNGTTKVVP
jgi:RimJ/RimL family protein N-acetyltransferase